MLTPEQERMLAESAQRRRGKIAHLEARLAALRARHGGEGAGAGVVDLVTDQLERIKELLDSY